MEGTKRVVFEQYRKDQKSSDTVCQYWSYIEPCVLCGIGCSEASKLTRQPADSLAIWKVVKTSRLQSLCGASRTRSAMRTVNSLPIALT